MAERLETDRVLEFDFEDPRQERVYRRLGELVGPGPAALYYDSCKLRSGAGSNFLSRTHLIGHLLREVESALRHVIAPALIPRPPVCPTCGLEPREGHVAMIRAALDVLEVAPEDPLRSAWTPGLDELAHRDNLSVPREYDQDTQDFFARYDSIFDLALQRFSERFLVAMERIDALRVMPTPAKRDARTLRTSFPNQRSIFERFFSDPLNVQWVEALRKADFLRKPPEHAVAPLLKYARRIAPSDPNKAEVVLRELPAIVGVEACVAYLSALEHLTIAKVPNLLPKVFSWLDAREQLSPTEQALTTTLFTNLATRLAQSGRSADSIALLEKLSAAG